MTQPLALPLRLGLSLAHHPPPLAIWVAQRLPNGTMAPCMNTGPRMALMVKVTSTASAPPQVSATTRLARCVPLSYQRESLCATTCPFAHHPSPPPSVRLLARLRRLCVPTTPAPMTAVTWYMQHHRQHIWHNIRLWDAAKSFACKCDPGFTGPSRGPSATKRGPHAERGL